MTMRPWLCRTAGVCCLYLVLSATRGFADESASRGVPLVAFKAPSAKPADKKTPDTLIEPFTPPPLAELDKSAQWTDSLVSDGIDLYAAFRPPKNRWPRFPKHSA